MTGLALPAFAQDGAAPAATAQRAPAITVVPAERREIVETVVVTGSLVPREEVQVGVDLDGYRIVELLADEGDRVEAGAVLARLDADTLDIQLAQNDSQLARADAGIAQARASIAEAEAAEAEARSALARAERLKERGVTAQAALDQATASADAATARLASARQSLALAEADKALTAAQRRELELRRAKTEIKAPTAGLVLSRTARIGAIASSAGGNLFTLARDAQIELDAEVPETVLHRIEKGQKVSVLPAGASEPIEGEVRLVSPQVDPATRLGRVRVSLPVDPALRTGAFSRGSVEIARREGVAVPALSVVTDENGRTVKVVKPDGTVETRTVETGLSGGAYVELVSGVAAGEDVILRAGTFVRDGDRVTPVKAPADAAAVKEARG